MAKRRKLHNVNCIEEYGIDECQFRMLLQMDMFQGGLERIVLEGRPLPKITIQDLDDKSIYKVFYPADLRKIATDDEAYEYFLDYCIDCGL